MFRVVIQPATYIGREKTHQAQRVSRPMKKALARDRLKREQEKLLKAGYKRARGLPGTWERKDPGAYEGEYWVYEVWIDIEPVAAVR